jgi:hypothetical protein
MLSFLIVRYDSSSIFCDASAMQCNTASLFDVVIVLYGDVGVGEGEGVVRSEEARNR